MLPNIGMGELVIVLVVVMIIFGVGRLGEIGGAMGGAIREFRKSQDDEPESLIAPATASGNTNGEISTNVCCQPYNRHSHQVSGFSSIL